MTRRQRIAWSLVVGLAAASPAAAGVFSGTVASINSQTSRLTVETKDGKSRTFRIPESAEVTVDDERSGIEEISAGQKVSVYVTPAGEVTRVRVRTAAPPAVATPAPAAAESRTEPEPPPPAGWPQFGGPLRDNRSGDTGLLPQWPTGGPPLVLKMSGLGVGYSSVALADGKLFTMGSRGEDECVIAFDAESGAELWARRIGRTRRDGMGDGPRSTPTVDGERVYALGANGDLACLSADDGEVQWSTNILQQFDASNIGWGISESVLIDGDRLICTPGGKKATMAALNKRTGAVQWTAKAPGNPAAAYASAIRIEASGVPQYVNFTHSAVIGVGADDGRFLWSNAASANGTANCASPVARREHVFSSSGYGQGCALVRVTGERGRGGAELVYKNKELKNHHGGLVLHEGCVYGADDGVIKCLDLMTGKVLWQDRSVGKGAVVYADGRVILRSEQGPVAMFDATPEAYRERGRFEQPERSNQSAWSHPVVTGGRMYLRDQDLLLVYDLRARP